jgi:hypothetical protein
MQLAIQLCRRNVRNKLECEWRRKNWTRTQVYWPHDAWWNLITNVNGVFFIFFLSLLLDLFWDLSLAKFLIGPITCKSLYIKPPINSISLAQWCPTRKRTNYPERGSYHSHKVALTARHKANVNRPRRPDEPGRFKTPMTPLDALELKSTGFERWPKAIEGFKMRNENANLELAP